MITNQELYNKIITTVSDFGQLFRGNLLSWRKKNVSFHCLLLDNRSRDYIFDKFSAPKGFIYINHHITFGLNACKEDSYFAKNLLGKRGKYKVTHVGMYENKIMAFRIESAEGCVNKIPHITFALDRATAKAWESNKITEWEAIKPFYVFGLHTEIIKQQNG